MGEPRVFDGIQYLQLMNENNCKMNSLEDNVYFTLRDIFANISGADYCMEANGFNSKLTNDISYDKRTIDFTYSNVLNDKIYIKQLSRWLSYINKSDFRFDEMNADADTEEKQWYFDTMHLFKFDDWWLQFEELKLLINRRLDNMA